MEEKDEFAGIPDLRPEIHERVRKILFENHSIASIQILGFMTEDGMQQVEIVAFDKSVWDNKVVPILNEILRRVK